MEHRRLPVQTSHPLEHLLSSDEPVRNQQARSEALLQAKLDVATAQVTAQSTQSRLAAQKELDAINERVTKQLTDVIRGTQGLRIVDPSAWSADAKATTSSSRSVPAVTGLQSSRSAPSGAKPATTTTVRASGLVVNPRPADRVSPSAASAAKSSARLVSSNGTPATTTNTATTSARAQAAAASSSSQRDPQRRQRTLSVDASAHASNYTFGFPSAFADSGFQSVIRWADVSFQEAQVAALGPRADMERLRAHELPNRVVVSVACYLLNEVLTREPHLNALWSQLRTSIFDAVFSPQLLATHLDHHQTRLALRAEKSLHEARTGAAPIAAAAEDGVLPPLPVRVATYEDVSDFANYRLWTEENVGARKDNAQLNERVTRLKGVVTNSRLVLLMAQRRVDTARKRSILLAWRAHTERVKSQREVTSAYVVAAHERRVSESCFLRWRRLTVQNRLDEVRQQYRELHTKWQTMADAHRHEINALKEKLQQEELERQTMAVRDAALRAQINDSYAMESTALRTALSCKQSQCDKLFAHAKRWERLAKTFRPLHVAPPVPRQLLTFAIQLRRFEDEFSASGAQNTRVFRVVNVRATMTKFLLRWTNAIMGASPYKNMWVNVKRLATRRDQVEATQSDTAAAVSSEEATVASAATASDPEAFSSYSLIYLVRELRRLVDRERLERCPSAAMQTVFGGTRASQDHTGVGGSGASMFNLAGSLLSSSESATGAGAATTTTTTSKAQQWLAELRQQHNVTLSGSDSGEDADEEENEDGAASASPGSESNTFGLGMSGKPTSEATRHRQLFAELCELLYLFTEEGARPSLLMHCPYVGGFFSMSLFASVPTHPTAMLWLLAALFTGYVESLCGFENAFFRGRWPPYLRCGNEEGLARRPNPSLTTVEDAEEMGLVQGKLPETHTGAGLLSSAGGIGGAMLPAAQGTYVLSSNSSVGKGPKGASGGTPRPKPSASGVVVNAGKKRGKGAGRLHRHDSMRSLGRALPNKSVRVTKMGDLELVRRGVDGEADILAYLGRDEEQEGFLHNLHGEETDVEALMAGIEDGVGRADSAPGYRGPASAVPPDPPGKRETDTARARRRQQRRLQQHGPSSPDGPAPLAMIEFTGETVLADDDGDDDVLSETGRQRAARLRSSQQSRAGSFYADLSVIQPPAQHTTSSDGGEDKHGGGAADMSGDDEEDLTDLGLRDDMNYLRAVLRAQEKVESEKATTLLVSPKRNLFSAEELYTLFRLPPPSQAFDAGKVLVRQNLKTVTSANASRTDAGGGSGTSDWHAAAAAQEKRDSRATALTSASEENASPLDGPTSGSGGSQTATSVRQPTTSVSAFLTYTLLDADRRQIWQGMARVLISLITRLRVLDTATSTNTVAVASSSKKSKAWKQRKSEVTSGRSGRSGSNRSLSSRSSSFVGVPDDDPALTRDRLAKPVRHAARRSPSLSQSQQDGVPGDGEGAAVSEASVREADRGKRKDATATSRTSNKLRAKKAAKNKTTDDDAGGGDGQDDVDDGESSVGAAPITRSPPPGTMLPPILQRSTTGSPPPPAPPLQPSGPALPTQIPATTATTTASSGVGLTQLGEALRQYQDRADDDVSSPAKRASTAPAQTAASAPAPDSTVTTHHTTTTTTTTAGGRPASSGAERHGVTVRAQHSNTAHYASPPPVAPGVPGDVRLAGAMSLNGDGSGGLAPRSTTTTTTTGVGQLSASPPATLGQRSGEGTTSSRASRPGLPQQTVPRTAPPGVDPRSLQPLVVHAGTSGEPGESSEGPANQTGGGAPRQPSLPPGSSKFRFDLKRGK